MRYITRLSDNGNWNVIFFCYQNIEYWIGEFKKLADYRILDLGLNLLDYWISESEKAIGCLPLICTVYLAVLGSERYPSMDSHSCWVLFMYTWPCWVQPGIHQSTYTFDEVYMCTWQCWVQPGIHQWTHTFTWVYVFTWQCWAQPDIHQWTHTFAGPPPRTS
jgi:hypothetical protein